MRAHTRIAWIAALCLACSALADESREGNARGERKRGSAAEKAEPAEREASRLVVYVPPSRGATRTRSGGGTRGPGNAPTLEVLAPDHTGLTNRAQPILAWFISEPTQGRVDFTVIEAEAVEPLLEVTLPGPRQAGVQLVRLADHGVELAQGRSYDWSIALVLNEQQRDLDVVSSAVIRWEPAVQADAQETESPSYQSLARRGVWYDALADLSQAIAARPGDSELLSERASLLEQVGLPVAAAFEREKMSHEPGEQQTD